MRTLVWFRGKDLRVADHAPLVEAAKNGEVIPLFVLDPFFFAHPERLPHRMQFLLASLRELSEKLAALGSRLVIARGKSVDVVPRLAEEWRVDRVVAHRWVEPFGRERDRRITAALRVPFDLYEGETLLPPGTVRTAAGTPFTVYTPFARAHRQHPIARPIAAPKSLPPLTIAASSDAIPTVTENPRVQSGGERAAHERLTRFVRERLADYHVARDRLDRDGTSRLSADLHFGTLSVRTVWHEAAALGPGEGLEKFRAELLWRDFAHDLLWHRPALQKEPFRGEFVGFPWRDDDEAFAAWAEGRTGFAVVDAAARELLETGYVHNRARMIAASFLTKHLLIDYRRGEQHYLRYLTDGDLANNNAGWQWSAGCGCDAQPYFRVFNPLLQAEKFDPTGAYARRWARPCAPIIDLDAGRKRFLAVAEAHLRGRPRNNPPARA